MWKFGDIVLGRSGPLRTSRRKAAIDAREFPRTSEIMLSPLRLIACPSCPPRALVVLVPTYRVSFPEAFSLGNCPRFAWCAAEYWDILGHGVESRRRIDAALRWAMLHS